MKKSSVNKTVSKKSIQKGSKTSGQTTSLKNNYLLYVTMFALFVTSLMVLSPMRNNEFITTWDDGIYVVKNQLLHDISWKGISNMFSYGDDFQKLINNYHPLTIFSLALNYQVSELTPASYHTTNLVLHGLNSVLVFLFVFLLSRRKLLPAAISGLLFAVHPMHVESVAWVSERKDVLYTFFFLAGLISYLKYLEDEKVWKLVVTLVLFILSCLSKAMAVPFPLIILLIDYFQRRKFSGRMLIEKIPFLIIAMIIGFMSVRLQATSAINTFETFTVYQRIMHASYGFVSYLVKFINPTELSAFYPYPAITTSGELPILFRVAPFVCLVVAGLLAWLSTKKGDIPRIVVFGVLFFFLTIALVLQFFSVGKAIMADRYTYIPYIGLSLIIGMVTDLLINQKSKMKYQGFALGAAALLSGIVFSSLTYQRTKVWKDDITLWTNVLQQFPDGRMNFIYDKRARQYIQKDQYDAALADYQTMIANDPRDDKALESMGRIYGQHYRDLGKAVGVLEKAYSINPKNPAVLKSLGVAMGMKGNFQRSLDLLLQAYSIDKTDTSLVRNIAASYRYAGMNDKAIEFEKLVHH